MLSHLSWNSRASPEIHGPLASLNLCNRIRDRLEDSSGDGSWRRECTHSSLFQARSDGAPRGTSGIVGQIVLWGRSGAQWGITQEHLLWVLWNFEIFVRTGGLICAFCVGDTEGRGWLKLLWCWGGQGRHRPMQYVQIWYFNVKLHY